MTEQKFIGGNFNGYRCLLPVPFGPEASPRSWVIRIPFGSDPTIALCWGQARFEQTQTPSPSLPGHFAIYANAKEPNTWEYVPEEKTATQVMFNAIR
jgi:hypothetical protein